MRVFLSAILSCLCSPELPPILVTCLLCCAALQVYGRAVACELVPVSLSRKRGERCVSGMYSSKQGGSSDVMRGGEGGRLVNLMRGEGEERGNEGEKVWAEQGEDEEDSNDVEFRVRGFISSNNYSGKKTTLILFINGEAAGP